MTRLQAHKDLISQNILMKQKNNIYVEQMDSPSFISLCISDPSLNPTVPSAGVSNLNTHTHPPTHTHTYIHTWRTFLGSFCLNLRSSDIKHFCQMESKCKIRADNTRLLSRALSCSSHFANQIMLYSKSDQSGKQIKQL